MSKTVQEHREAAAEARRWSTQMHKRKAAKRAATEAAEQAEGEKREALRKQKAHHHVERVRMGRQLLRLAKAGKITYAEAMAEIATAMG